MFGVNPCSTPIPAGCKLQSTKGNALQNSENYRRLVGRLLYLTMTRPDLTFVVQQLSQFMASHTYCHWKVTQKIPKGNLPLQVVFPLQRRFKA